VTAVIEPGWKQHSAVAASSAITLKRPLTSKQLSAASSLHRRIPEWVAIDKALDDLSRLLPDFALSSCLLKVCAINQLYGTNVRSIGALAAHINRTMAKSRSSVTVAELATTTITDGRVFRYFSFASKFAHFFVDADRFAVYDSYALDSLRVHVAHSSLATTDAAQRYAAFVTLLSELRGLANLHCTNRELDRYLWLSGLYRASRDGDTKINAEARRLFGMAAENASVARDLELLISDGE
jgi:hypothetical protein